MRSKKEKTEPPLNRALKYLANAAQRYKPVLAAELDKSKDQKEKGAILNSLDLCEQIIGAAAKPIK